MKPSNEALDAQARHFANSVFAIGAGAIMLSASSLQTLAMNALGANGGDLAFIAATLCILLLASQRSRFALWAIERQCAKHGHAPRQGSSVCGRCLRSIAEQSPPA